MTENQVSEQLAPMAHSYFLIWVGLLILTGITVFCSTLHLGRLAIWIALAIASTKGWLVAWFFMHLKEEPSFIKFGFLTTIIVLAVFIGLTFFDVLYR